MGPIPKSPDRVPPEDLLLSFTPTKHSQTPYGALEKYPLQGICRYY